MNKHKRILPIMSYVLTSIFIFTSCMSTPTDNAVINKNDGKLDEKIKQKASETYSYIALREWKEVIMIDDQKNISIEINAAVETVDVDRYPVMKVRPREITQEMANQYLDKLIGDNTFYKYRTIATKEELQQEILKIKRMISDPNSGFNIDYKKGTSEYEEALNGLEADIRFLEKQMEGAPDTEVHQNASKIFAPQEFKDNPDVDYVVIEGYTKKDDVTDLEILIQKNKVPPYFKQYLQVYSFLRSPIMNQYPLSDNLDGTEISYYEAKELAESYLKNLGFQAYGLSLSCIADQMDAMKIALTPKEDWIQCYVFYFTPMVGNVPLTYNKFSLLSDQTFNQTWEQEYIKITVDDIGVTGFSWICPMEMTDTLNENVELLPFDNIKEIIKNNLMYNINFYDADPNIIERKITINRIVLGYTKIRIQNSNEFMLVPSWSLFGYEINKYDGQPPGGFKVDENNEYKQEAMGQSYLTINAIDGSIIDFSQGY